eukprot:12900498-Alexandrium_andersonii.AAC.1
MDSSAAQGFCNRSGIGKAEHLAAIQLWVRKQIIKDGTSAVQKVREEVHPADLVPKRVDREDTLALPGAAFVIAVVGYNYCKS